jgi:hypothetical protein
MSFRFLLFVAFGAALAILCNKVSACDLRATWTPPTTRENGTAFNKSEIGKYELRFVQQSGGTKKGVKYPKVGTTGYLLKGLLPGAWHIDMRVFDQSGLPSQWSVGVVRYCSI